MQLDFRFKKPETRFDHFRLKPRYRSIDPSILEQQLSLSKCANFGIDGASYIESYLILSQFLKTNRTKYILLAADLEGFEPTDSELKFRLSKYLPYSDKNTIKPILKEVYGINYFFMQAVPFLKYAKYNDEIGISSVAKVVTGKLCKEYDDRGCAFRAVPFKDEEIQVQYLPIEKRHLEYLEQIVELAQSKNCTVILFIAPYYTKWKEHHRNSTELVNIYQRLAVKYKIQLLSFDNGLFESDRTYFSDLNHLNNIGAVKYTNYLAEQLHTNID